MLDKIKAVYAGIRFSAALGKAGYTDAQFKQIIAALDASANNTTDPMIKSDDYVPGKSGWIIARKNLTFEVNPPEKVEV